MLRPSPIWQPIDVARYEGVRPVKPPYNLQEFPHGRAVRWHKVYPSGVAVMATDDEIAMWRAYQAVVVERDQLLAAAAKPVEAPVEAPVVAEAPKPAPTRSRQR